VLSGGGATAMVHVGFLRVLEQNQIPIDFIGGTSMGAAIAAMYASGMSVAEIDSIVHSREFFLMANGDLADDMRFYYMNSSPDASAATIKFKKGHFNTNALPTNLINPVLMDWKFMEGFSQADAAADYSFDSLFIPFRCIAADVEKKQEIIFRDGPMNVAVRASATYPFYLPPRRVNGALLYDGGIYNNFPLDVVYKEFLPDVILGCNVSGESPIPSEDDLFSQLQSMIMFRDPLNFPCEHIVVVRPEVSSIGTFAFNMIDAAIASGEKAARDSLDAMLALIDRKVSPEELAAKRAAFRAKFKPLIIEEVTIEGLDKSQKSYINKIVGRRLSSLPLGDLKTAYFRVYADEKIKSIFPTLRLNPATGLFKLSLDVQKEKDLFVSFGGNFSSRSINTGFVGLRYNIFRKTATTLTANSYFGRFYGSIHGALKWDVASQLLPFTLELSYTQNRWDYYKSLSTFFEDVKPSFILLNERFGNFAINIPAGNKGTVRVDASYASLFDQYYQTNNFLSVDTADRTEFHAGIVRLTYDRNTLNRIQYANRGTRLLVTAKSVFGKEATIPGTTSIRPDSVFANHQWLSTKLSYINYFFRRGWFHMGLSVEGVYSTQPFFSNFISSSILAPVYQPIVESQTFFLSQFRAHRYAAGGLISDFVLSKNVDLRVEAYVFTPFGRLSANAEGRPLYDLDFRQFYMGSGALIYHSPLGPISFSVNYYDQKQDPWSVLFNFGYIIFNRSARD
jgi:NTE family protein